MTSIALHHLLHVLKLIVMTALIFCVILSVASALFRVRTEAFLMSLFGRRRHIEITSPELANRIRARYRSETDQLTANGFSFLFFEGEASSLASALLIFPAIVMLLMLSKREVISIQHGLTFVTARPIFASRDRTSYGHPSGLGIIFHTGFHDGSRLVSANYGEGFNDIDPSGSKYIRRLHARANIHDTWTAHQREIRLLLDEGRRIATELTFTDYVAIIS
ncbi:MAG TPA: hypothetical protein VF865_11525 [Acidobacteriaceae bacterium]